MKLTSLGRFFKKRAPRGWSSENMDHVVAVCCIVFSWWLMSFTFGYEDGEFVIASKLWSDFGAHIPLIRSFSMGANWPPEYPQFPGQPIRYHYLFYLMVGLLERVGLRIDIALNLLSAAGFALLLWMLYRTAILFFKSRAAGVLSIVLFLSNGSLSYIRFLEKVGTFSFSAIWQSLQQLTAFVSFGPWDGQTISAFWTLNIYTNQRHLGMGFGVFLVLLYPIFERAIADQKSKTVLSRNKSLVLLLLLATLPLLHQAAYMSFLIVSGMWILLYWKHYSIRWLLPYVLGFVISLISLYSISQGPTTHSVIWSPGYLSQTTNFGLAAVYWFDNFGLYLPMLLAVLLAGPWQYRRLLIIASPLFVAANTLLFSPDMINNHKLLNIFILFVQLMTAGLLVSWWREGWQKKVLVCCFLPFLLFSGVVDFLPIIRDNHLFLPDYKKNAEALWFANNTDPSSTVLTTVYFYNSALLAGRKSFLDYGYFDWSMGYDDAKRRALLPSIFATDTTLAGVCRILEKENVDYVFISQKGDLDTAIHPTGSAFANLSQPLLRTTEGDAIYSVAQSCAQ